MKPYDTDDLKKRSRIDMSTDELRKFHQDIYYRLTLRDLLSSADDQSHYEVIREYLKEVKLEPFYYFGLLGVDYPDLILTPGLASSKYARVMAYQRYLHMLTENRDMESHVRNQFKLNLEEIIVEALVLGEQAVKYQQEERNLTRREAVLFVLDFNLASVYYFLACKEFMAIKDDIFKNRQPKWKDLIEKDFGSDYKYLRSKHREYIKRVSDMFYAEREARNG